MSRSLPAQAGAPAYARYRAPVLEWALWMALVGAVYSQTGYFDTEIPEYAFGATGWPRALCLATAAGATGQLLTRLAALRRGEPAVASPASAPVPATPPTLWEQAKRLAIFLFPLLYLYAVPTLGFYLATPVFVLGLLLILDVRSPGALLGVTGVVCALVLLLFTRFFYVALPVGQPPFYDINNAIIVIARMGL